MNLFGNQPGGSSLFNNSNNAGGLQSTGGGGLSLGTQSTGGGLQLGGQSQQPIGSLLGTQNQQSTGGGLQLGGQQQQPSLFSNQQQNQQPGGLFQGDLNQNKQVQLPSATNGGVGIQQQAQTQQTQLFSNQGGALNQQPQTQISSLTNKDQTSTNQDGSQLNLQDNKINLTDQNKIQESQLVNSTQANMTIEELFRKWKKEIEEQYQQFQSLGKDLNTNEVELIDLYQMMLNLHKITSEVNGEYQNVNNQLQSIENQQSNIMSRLTGLEKDLDQYLPQDIDDQYNQPKNVILQAQKLNKEVTTLDDQLQKLVNEINMPYQNNDNALNRIMNSYYDALESIELDTINIQNKLQQLEQEYSRNQS